MIIPGVGIGVRRVGQRLSEIDDYQDISHPSADRDDLMLIRVGEVEAILHSGVVVQVISSSSKAGVTPRGIHVGTSYRHLVSLATLEYDEHQGLWADPGDPGVSYELVRPNRRKRTPEDPAVVPELYDVTDPDHAFVGAIFVEPFGGVPG